MEPQVGSILEGKVTTITKFGAFVAVENYYQGLIPKQELHQKLRIGDVVPVRVAEVRDDGKLTLSMQKLSYMQMEEDSEMVYQAILAFDGVLPFTDKASPAVIEREMGLSKNAFKRAVGHLYKQRVIDITDGKIRLVK